MRNSVCATTSPLISAMLNLSSRYELSFHSRIPSQVAMLQERAIKNFTNADPKYGGKIRELIDTVYTKNKPEKAQANL